MSAGGVALVFLIAVGLSPAVGADAAAGRSGDAIRTELLPSENPMPKKTAQSATSPKNRASILPVPNVISVSCDVAVVICTSSFLLPMETAQLFAAAGAASPSGFANSFCMPEKKSTGTGKTTVVFFSTPISVNVCR
jgi:hypothetical protein